MRRDNAELIAMLAPKAIDMLAVGGGATPALTPLDVAAAMHSLAPMQCELLLVKYAQAPGQLLLKLWLDVLGQESWAKDPRRVKRMAFFTLLIYIGGDRCGTCKGTGQTADDSLVVECDACRGTGFARLSRRRIARALGLTPSKLDQAWLDRVDTCLERLKMEEINALAEIRL